MMPAALTSAPSGKIGNRLVRLHEDAAVLALHRNAHLSAAAARDGGHEAAQGPRRAGGAVQGAGVDRRQAGAAGQQPGAGRNGG